ncbi:hypothetical protein CHUAL_000286 [Chamberlinius hualienensis]
MVARGFFVSISGGVGSSGGAGRGVVVLGGIEEQCENTSGTVEGRSLVNSCEKSGIGSVFRSSINLQGNYMMGP